MRHTLVATFERHVDAQRCAGRLEQGGLPAGSVNVTERSAAQAHEQAQRQEVREAFRIELAGERVRVRLFQQAARDPVNRAV